MKTVQNTDSDGAKKNVSDIQFWGDGDTFKLISKAWSKKEGWMKSTKAMEIPGVGCVVQVTTQQISMNGLSPFKRDENGDLLTLGVDSDSAYNMLDAQKEVENHAVAEALAFVPGAKIAEDTDDDGNVISRRLVSLAE